MSRHVVVALAAASVVLASWAAVSEPWAAPARGRPVTRRVPSLRLGIVPAPADSQAEWLLQRGGSSVLFSGAGLTLHLPSARQPSQQLGWRVVGGRTVTPRAEGRQPGAFHRMVGPREEWETGLPVYGGVRYPGVLPGVDLWFEERPEGLEYGFRAERGRDLRQVRLEYAGARALRVLDEGRTLEAEVEGGTLREEGLTCWQEALDGARHAVGCRFAQAREVGWGRWEYTLRVDVEEPERPVVVDPTLRWGLYQGDNWKDELGDMVLEPQTGDLYVIGSVGRSASSTPSLSKADVYLARFSSEGQLRWAGGLGQFDTDDFGTAIALGPEGELYIAGTTSSADWYKDPADGGMGTRLKGTSDGFVAQVIEPPNSSVGPELAWLLHVGGTSEEQLNDLTVVGGTLFAVGATRSSDLPNLRGNAGPVSGLDAFVARIDPTSLSYATRLLQGQLDEVAYAVGSLGPQVYFAGNTTSPLPDGGPRSGQDLFVGTVVNVEALPESAPLYLGGTGDDEARVLVGTRQAVWLVGTTASNAFVGSTGITGETDLFTGRLSIANSAVAVSGLSLIPGAGRQEVFTAVFDKLDTLHVGGSSTGLFTTSDAFDKELEASGVDGFVASIDFQNQPPLRWASLVGGTGVDAVRALQVDSAGRLFIGGQTRSRDRMPFDGGVMTPDFNGENNLFLLTVETDDTPPMTDLAEVVVVGPELNAIQEQSDTTTLSFSWTGFQEPESSITRYTYLIRDKNQQDDVRGLGEAGTEPGTLTATNLNLELGNTYEVVIRAYNRVGLSDVKTSNGVTIVPGTPDAGQDGGVEPADGGQTADAGADGGGQPGDGGTDAGVDAGTDGGVDAGTDGGMKPGPERSPMGFSCGCTAFQGSGGMALGALLGLALLTSRRRTQRTIWMCGMPSSSYTPPSARKPKSS